MSKTWIAALMPLAAAACMTAPATPTVRVAPVTAPGPDFLVRNAAQPGVVSTASGLQYYVLKSGDPAGVRPVDGDTVSFDYDGTLTDGTKFDSSYDAGKPLVGQVGGFVPGFDEALKLMRPGDEWVVWIPANLGYGARALPGIPANSTLRFKLALHSVGRSA